MKVQIIYINNGTEFTLNKFKDWCKNRGIILITTILNYLEQNPIIERYSRTIVKGARIANFKAGFLESY